MPRAKLMSLCNGAELPVLGLGTAKFLSKLIPSLANAHFLVVEQIICCLEN
ncbi:putative 1 [Tropilaelaps mercedesae]|uniref:Putative 1 n=1 Tax=Tropilaelaps mercedesae TaxID=418985 RepID=A0A1V9Y3N5_9ACAR|nr:putative 1 [Tropilaelaps mercedesae]